MKVAYNACFGGFGLSHSATLEYAKRKGVTLTAYKQTKYEHSGGIDEYERVFGEDAAGMFILYATKDLGETISELPSELHYYNDFYSNESRCDKDLIDIIESFGDAASGIGSDLDIEEIPDGAEFEIDEYDGNESVVPPRQSW